MPTTRPRQASLVLLPPNSQVQNPNAALSPWQVKEFSETGGEAPKPSEEAAKPAGDAAAAGSSSEAKAPGLDDQTPKFTIVTTKTLEKPADEAYTQRIPPGLNQQEIEVIKLAAQFVARNGKVRRKQD